jgi:hypothetical protein
MNKEPDKSLLTKIKDSYILLMYSKTVQIVINEKIKQERLSLKLS